MRKGFTLIELVAAVALLAIVLYSASKVFRVSIEAHRTASANAEIMRKLRAITDQLNADFKGLRKDGEIFVVWVPEQTAGYDYDGDGYVRFDRIVFLADGDFQSYGTSPIVRGNLARISYMLANRRPENPGDPPIKDHMQRPKERILARTQHILTADSDPQLVPFPDPSTFGGSDQEWNNWHTRREYDKISVQGWKNVPWRIDPYPYDLTEPNKPNMLSVITDVIIGKSKGGGAIIDPGEPNSIHMFFCDGVGEFKIQGWHAGLGQWLPQVDPDGDRDLRDTHFFIDLTDPTRLDPIAVPGVLYPYPPYGAVVLGGEFYCDRYTLEGQKKFRELQSLLNEAHFNDIPGLGRALKFTFTLYDSRGILKNGRTFTHIVYIGN